MEDGFRLIWGRELGLCGEGRFARAHVKSPTLHSRSQCISLKGNSATFVVNFLLHGTDHPI